MSYAHTVYPDDRPTHLTLWRGAVPVEAEQTNLSLWRGAIPVGARPERMADIVAVVARLHGLSVAEVVGPSRFRNLVMARAEAVWRMRQTGRWSWPQIAKAIGRKDHTSAMHLFQLWQSHLDCAPTEKIRRKHARSREYHARKKAGA